MFSRKLVNRMKKNIKENLPFLTIVIPCFNEAQNIPLILKRFDYLKKEKNLEDIFEILFVNNGSNDNTIEILNENIKRFSFAKFINIEKNLGYGYGIITGLAHTSSEFVGWTHGDLQTDPKDIICAIQIIRNFNFSKKLFIKGVREGRSIFDQFFSDSMSIFESLLFFSPLYEINAQPTIFHRSLYQKCLDPPIDFSLDLYFYILAIKSNLIIERIRVKFLKRIYGSSKWNKNIQSKFKFIMRTLNYSIRLRIKLFKK